MNKQKRMVYIYEENVEAYDSLDNKSEFINNALFERKKAAIKQPNIDYVKQKLAEMESREKALRLAREA